MAVEILVLAHRHGPVVLDELLSKRILFFRGCLQVYILWLSLS